MSADFLMLKDSVLTGEKMPVTIGPAHDHKFSTNLVKTTFRVKNSAEPGSLEVWVKGKKEGGGAVPANADETKSYSPCGWTPVTVKNTGKSTLMVWVS